MDWKEVSRERVWDGFRKIDRCEYQLPDGQVAPFEIKREPMVVLAMVVTTEKKVVVAKQYRPGPGKDLLELPGGAIDEGETPEAAVAREVLEETGYAGTVQFAGTCYADAYSTMQRHNFLITDAKKVQEAAPEDHEFIEVLEMNLNEFVDHVRSGELTDTGGAYQCLHALGVLKTTL